MILRSIVQVLSGTLPDDWVLGIEPSWISQFGPMLLELAVDGMVLLGPLVLIVALAGTLLVLTVPAEYKSSKFMACSIFGSGGLNK